jgi:hypothetical protein
MEQEINSKGDASSEKTGNSGISSAISLSSNLGKHGFG